MAQNSPKIYLAGKLAEAPALRALGQALERHGFEITAPWYDFDQGDLNKRSSALTKLIGMAEYDGVLCSDYYVGILNDNTYAYKGTLTEMGIALGNFAHDQDRSVNQHIFLITPKDFTSENCVALTVPHTTLVTHVPIMNGPDIVENVPLIVDWAKRTLICTSM